MKVQETDERGERNKAKRGKEREKRLEEVKCMLISIT